MAFIVCLQPHGLHCLLTVYSWPSLSAYSLFFAFNVFLQTTQGLPCHMAIFLFTVYSGPFFCLQSGQGLQTAYTLSGPSLSAYSLLRAVISAYSLPRAFFACLYSSQGLRCLLTYSQSLLSVYSLLSALIVCLQSTQGLHCLLTVTPWPSSSVYTLLSTIIDCLQSGPSLSAQSN